MRDAPARFLAASYGVCALFAGLVAGFVFGTFGVLPFAWLPRGRRERYAMSAAVGFATVCVRGILLARPDVRGALDLGPREGAILLCNHRSWLDPLLLMAYTRSNGLSKREIFWIPFVGVYGWLAGAVFFDRRDPAARLRARADVLALVRSGHRLQVFPEGTRSTTGQFAERVHLVLARDAWSDGLPVVGCAVWGTERVLPPHRFAAWPGQRVQLVLGRTLRPADHPDADAFAAACWDEVRRCVAIAAAEVT